VNGIEQIGGLLVGFLMGSIPFGYILVRLVKGTDVRDSGSGNIGATNVGRALGAAGGVATLVLDAGKGVAGVVLAATLGLGAPAAALGAVLGHCYTPWLRLRGGKGVATLLGAFAAVTATSTAFGAGVLVLVAAVSRMMSLASLCGAVALAVAAWWLGEPTPTVIAASIAAAVIIWRHRANIRRILKGEESKLGGMRAR